MAGNGCAVNLQALDRKRWKGYSLPMQFTSEYGYDVAVVREGDDFRAVIERRKLAVPFEKSPNDDDQLFKDHWEDVEAWGVVDSDKLLAVVETASEGWANRLRITELWVDESLRRKGVATDLMDRAVQRAREKGRRMVVLETQSNNVPAIDFYLAYGFTLIGFDTHHYSNVDLTRREVRLEFGIELETMCPE